MSTSLAVRTSPPLAFQNVTFDAIDRNGHPWLRIHQIEGALGYAGKGRALQLIYSRHAAEFTDSMTALVKLPTAGGEQETRIFSLRGAHLLGMFARTPIAADFRRWVLDILDKEAAPTPQPPSIIARRWLTTFDHSGRETVQPIEPEYFFLKIEELPELIRDVGFMIDGALVIEVLHACADRLGGKLAGRAHRLSD